LRKLKALFYNEIIKIRLKPSVIVFLVLSMFAGMLAPVGVRLIAMFTASAMTYYQSDSTIMEEDTKNSIAGFQKEIDDITARIASIEAMDLSPEEKDMMLAAANYELGSAQDRLDIYSLALENKVYPGYDGTFAGESIAKLTMLRMTIRDAEAVYEAKPSDNKRDEIDLLKSISQDYEAVLKTKDFHAFLDAENRRIDADSSLTVREKETQLELLAIRLALMPDGNITPSQDGDARMQAYYDIADKMLSLDSGVNSYTGSPMTLKERQFAESELRIMNYRLDNSCYPLRMDDSDRLSAFNTSISFGMFFVTIMMIIIAGGTVSHEISTGSIKSLIIAPVKRYKIWIAKLCSLVVTGLVAVLLLYLASNLGHGFVYGFNSTVPYVYIAGDAISMMPAYVFVLLKALIAYVDVLFLICFAFMCSIISRNTALSVALPLGAFFGGSIAKQACMMLPNMEMLKFMPFNNLDLTGRLFPYAGLMSSGYDFTMEMMQTPFNYQTPPAIFSLIYLGVLAFTMLFISFDSFTRRDIR